MNARRYSAYRREPTPAEREAMSLEKQADELLADTLKSKKRNKSRVEEYPILSASQVKRRHSKELSIADLPIKQRLRLEEVSDSDDGR
jgi:hypothetical protein